MNFMVIQDVSNAIKPPPQAALSDRSWPFLGSAAVHALFFTMLVNPVFQSPLILGSQQSPTVLWFSLFASPENGGEAALPRTYQPAAFQAPQYAPADQFYRGLQSAAVEQKPEVSLENVASSVASAEVSTTPVPAQPAAATEPEQTLPAQQSPLSVREQKAEIIDRDTAERLRAPIPAQLDKPVPQPLKKVSEPPKPEKPAAVPLTPVASSIRGDLKLVISGTTLPETTVTFTDFAPSRRDRPISRAESRRYTKITPVITGSQDTVREIVIVHARPGIYTITADSVNTSADIVVALKLYEGTARTSVRELGKHSLANKKILMKILMPEGILWDDAAAFSGSMEDSEGITKFNTDSGLMWREYSQ
ncbi:MAG TPA: hypothetical protein HPP97_14720 [Desulfuromonadales bacterium]|nr:hypothetical protein [Desulfuromonadales bacterium]